MNQKSGHLNYVFWLVCILSIIRNLTNIFKSFASLLSPERIDYMGMSLSISSHPASIYSILSSLCVISTIVLTLNKRKIGVWGFFAVQFVSAIVSLAFFEEPFKQMPISLGIAFIHCAVFFFLLLIKRDGISSWSVIFNGEEDDDFSFKQDDNNIEEDINNEINIESDESLQNKRNDIIQNECTEDFQNENTDDIQNGKIEEFKGLNNQKSFENTDEGNSLESVSIQRKDIVDCQDDQQGDLLESEKLNKRTQNCKKRKNFKAITIIVTSLVLLASISYGIWVEYNNSQPENQYAKANNLFGKGRIKDAINIYTKLVEENDYVPAKTRLGELYTMNDSVTHNYKLGIKYLTENALIDSIALADLMDIYMPGSVLCEGKYASREKIEYYAKMALKQKHYIARSYYYLGNLEAERNNYELAFYYWEKSGQLGYSSAFDNLGWMYYYGNGVKEDNTKAKYYFDKALSIQSDDHYALYYLGTMFENGYGVSKDMYKGLELLKRSADLGNEEAKKEVARIQMKKKSLGIEFED